MFLIPDHNYPTVPGVHSCQRLDCRTTNQPLSLRLGAPKAAASGRMDGYKVGFVKVTVVFVDVQPECSGSRKTVMSLEITSLLNFFSSTLLPYIKRNMMFVLAGCQRGIHVTIFRKTKTNTHKRGNSETLK